MLLGDSEGFRAREDIMKAKKILYEGDAPSKNTLIHLLIVLVKDQGEIKCVPILKYWFKL